MKTCAHSQYGCTDKDLNDCGEEVTPPPLCVVDGPCYAGPAGCLEDKTGADDGLPPGEYVGHCPAPKSPEQRCADCRDGCAGRYPSQPPMFEACLSQRCYFEAKKRCETEEALPDTVLQRCVKDVLNGTIPENYRCLMQYADTERYCEKLGYQRGINHFQGCIKKEFDGVCSTEFRCAPQFRDARKYCNQQKHIIGGPDHQKCISDQLVDTCPKDVGCKKRHTDAREYCKKQNTFGGPEFQQCIADVINPSCPADFQCPLREKDAAQYCRSQGNSSESDEFKQCVEEALKNICPVAATSKWEVEEL
ncbi:hypothetical protein NLG97_g3425 [Lecanicillium saksenae]|uniref:Uncharacterized protein n=1 Tax=Lecanicillium saksenae TaxID=468837 RepID=A0ACC1R1D2_9HYPO|nr:hypothetical protein NLG97_g3425 [Lecanicillium saksenae]